MDSEVYQEAPTEPSSEAIATSIEQNQTSEQQLSTTTVNETTVESAQLTTELSSTQQLSTTTVDETTVESPQLTTKQSITKQNQSVKDQLIGTYTTDASGVISVSGLEDGVYYFKEVSAPAGYSMRGGQHTFYLPGQEGLTITVENDWIKPDCTIPTTEEPTTTEVPTTEVPTTEVPTTEVEVTFSKTDIHGDELPGATVQVIDESGKIVKEWISTGTPMVITLEPGTYTFHEEAAPKGYKVATDISFTVNPDGTVTSGDITVTGTTIVMVDDYEVTPTDVTFSKTDIHGKELPGATVQVIDENGNVVKEWISTDTPMVISLEPGTYTFHEVAAPKGYEVATDISFTVNPDGTVTTGDITVTGNTIVMVDDYADVTNSEQSNENGPKHTNTPKVNRSKGGQSTLPSTGDVSEYLTVIGLISLMSGAFVTLRKRA